MKEQLGINLVRTRQLISVQRRERRLVLSIQGQGFFSRVVVDVIKLPIGAVIADHRCENRRKICQVTDVLVSEVLKSFICRRVGECSGNKQVDEQYINESFHIQPLSVAIIR
jgi:hypothetical protein